MDPLTWVVVGMGLLGLAGNIWGANQTNKTAKEEAEKNRQFQEEEAEKAYQRTLGINALTFQQQKPKEQVKQLKQAGLSSSLMYQNGGGVGGAGSSNTQAQASSNAMPNLTNPFANTMGMSTIAMQAKQTQADVELKKAEADRAKAEADKIRGVDTKKTEEEILNLGETRAGQKLQNILQEITNDIQRETKDANIAKINAESREQVEDALTAIARRSIAEADAQVAQTTINARTETAFEQLALLKAETILKRSQAEYTDEQKKYVADQIAIAWANVATGQQNAGTAADAAYDNYIHQEWVRNQQFPKEQETTRKGQNKALWSNIIGAVVNVAGSLILKAIPAKYTPTQESYSETKYDAEGHVKSSKEGSRAKY